MKPNELRKLSADELTRKQGDLTQELFNLTFQLHTGRLENTSKLKIIRKDIARISTIITESKAGSNR
ncbi:MAG: 50S ribosomal protein L29 [Oryzomonas sp.]|jgi:large subunit ribosomal protein L29